MLDIASIKSFIINTGLNILIALAVLLIGWWIINKSRKIFISFMQKTSIETGMISFLDSALKLSLRTILIISILPTFGINISSILTAIGASMVAVGLALKDSLANIASGVLLIIYNPFRVGDYIEMDGIKGTVSKVEMMFTTLISENSKVIIVPNSKLTNNSIVRTSKHNIEKNEVNYNIKGKISEGDLNRVIGKLILTNDKILQIPPSKISVAGEEEKNLKIEFWTEITNTKQAKDNLDKGIKGISRKYEIEISEH